MPILFLAPFIVAGFIFAFYRSDYFPWKYGLTVDDAFAQAARDAFVEYIYTRVQYE